MELDELVELEELLEQEELEELVEVPVIVGPMKPIGQYYLIVTEWVTDMFHGRLYK